MSNGRLKAVLIISLAFNLAVVGTLAYGWVSLARVRGRESVSIEDTRNSFRVKGRRLARRVGLPEEKARRFEQIIEESGGETSSCRSKLREARRELMDLLDTEEPDEKAVLKKVEEISGLQGELEKLLVQRLLRSRSILDHEESKRFLRLIRRRMGHGSRRHHPRRNPVERKGII